MSRLLCLAPLLCAATCQVNQPGPDNTVTTPSTPGTATINGTLECEDPIPTPNPGSIAEAECVVEELFCGDVVQGSNDAGELRYDSAFWETAQALGSLSQEPGDILDGPERVYMIRDQPPGSDVRVTVTSCVQLWVSYRQHGDMSGDWCDTSASQGAAGHFNGPWRDKEYTLLNRAAGFYDWEIIIDSYDGQVGNYTIQVECFGFE